MTDMTETEIIAEPGTPFVRTQRVFDAPPELLYRAHVEPKLLERWLGPRRLTMSVTEMDVRDGGVWRFTHTDDDGSEYRFRGVFHGDPSVDGIVRTFEYEGAPGHVALEKATFEAHEGGTLVTRTSVHQTVEARDAMIEAGMSEGVNDGDERLEELLADLRSAAR